MNWTPFDTGPAGGTRALAAAGGMLYAVDTGGRFWRCPATKIAATWWQPATFTAANIRINALAANANILFASTTDNRLLRTNQDWIDESSDWIDIHHCNFSVGLAVVDGMLFVATTQNQVWRLDLCPLRLPLIRIHPNKQGDTGPIGRQMESRKA